MSLIGRSINLALALLVCVSVAGTAGATLFYQESVDELDTENSQLRERNERLRQDLQSTRTDLQETRQRLRELNESLSTTRSDVNQV